MVVTVLILVVATCLLLMGAGALAAPERVVRLFGVATLPRDGRNEVRAVYGGFGVAVATLLLVSLQSEAVRNGALLTVSVALLGMAAGRVLSALLEHGMGRIPWLFLVVELLLAALLLLAR